MQPAVPFFQLRDFPAGLGEQVQAVLAAVAQQGNFILGPQVHAFEQAFSAFVGGGAKTVGVGNGYDALVMALRASGVAAGDEVIVPSNSYMATVNAVLQVGARPVLVEPDSRTYNLTAASAAEGLSANTKAILPVHLYGQACEMGPLLQLAEAHQLKVIEDAAQAHGATYRARQAGTFGFCNAFSFYPTKNLGALGDAGAVVTADAAAEAFLRQYRNYGQAQKYVGEVIGINSRLDELQAAVLQVKLAHLKQLNDERQRLAQLYLQQLQGAGDLILPHVAPDCEHVFHIFCIRTAYRAELQEWLQRHHIATAVHYPVPVHLQPAYRKLNYKKGELPLAEELAQTSLSLPLFPGMAATEQQAVVQAVWAFFQRR